LQALNLAQGLKGDQLVVSTTLSEKFLVSSDFGDSAFFEKVDQVTVLDG
jgi:hypothetical protein